MKITIKAKVFLILLPLVALSLLVLITMVLPCEKIGDRLTALKRGVEQAVLFGQLGRMLDRQVDDYQDYLASGQADPPAGVREIEPRTRVLIQQLKRLTESQAKPDPDRVSGADESLAEVIHGYEQLIQLRQEGIRLVRQGERAAAEEKCRTEIDPLVLSLMERCERFILDQEASFKKNVYRLGSVLGIPFVEAELREVVEATAIDAEVLFRTDGINSDAARLFRSYRNAIDFGSERGLADATTRMRLEVANWKSQTVSLMRQKGDNRVTQQDLNRIEERYLALESCGKRLLELVHQGKRAEAQERSEGELSTLEPLFVTEVERLIAVKEGELTRNMDRMVAAVRRIQFAAGALAALMLLAAFGCPFLISRTLVNPILALKEAADRVGAGALDTRVAIRSEDELGQLGEAFNVMSDSMAQMTARFQEANEQLEVRIASRTAELRRTNERLDRELQVRRRTEKELRKGQAELLVNHEVLKDLNRQMIEKNREVEAAYAELKATHAQLLQSEKMASLGQLAAGVAHEINNPIGFVSSNLGTLQKYAQRLTGYLSAQATALGDGESEATRQLVELRKEIKLDYVLRDIPELIRESMEGTERVRKIVADLKLFSRKDEADLVPVDVNGCLDSTMNIIWNELKYKATVHKEYGELPLVPGYPGQLNQVFMNLLVNAAHAIEKEGEILVRSWQEGERVLVSISDTGCGIPEANLTKIFEPFFTTKEVGMGTGLGLSITYDIVKKHGGEISVESTVGKGTIFTIGLPTESAA